MRRWGIPVLVLTLVGGGTANAQTAGCKPDIPDIALPDLTSADRDRLRRQMPRMALLFGNGSGYRDWTPLHKTEQDACSMAAALKHIGYDTRVVLNATAETMDREIQAFVKRLKDSKADGLFFFSGHGQQRSNLGYLIPVDGPPPSSVDDVTYRQRFYSVQRILKSMEEARDGLDVLIIDACRNDPQAMGAMGDAPPLLQPIAAGKRSIVAFGTQSGHIATEAGPWPHSPFTEFMLHGILKRGEEAVTMLRQVRTDMETVFHGEIRPEFATSVDARHVYFLPPSCTPEDENTAWSEAERTDTAAGYRGFVTRCPDSVRAGAANKLAAKAEELERPKPPPVPPAVDRPASLQGLKPGQTLRDSFIDGSGEGPEMVVVSKGEFWMGSTKETDGDEWWSDERESPRHTVTIGYDLAVGKYTVTVGEYGAFTTATGRQMKEGCYTWTGTDWKKDAKKTWREPGFSQTDRYPVVCVDWDDAQAYVGWLSKQTGQPYRLLSEAEWEYAARAGTTTRRYWGDDADHRRQCEYANGADQVYSNRFPRDAYVNNSCSDGQIFTAPVGKFKANGFGLYDMLGNVWQWTGDCWHADYKGAPSNGDSWTTLCTNDGRVLRGGSWDVSPRDLRSAIRGRIAPDSRNYIIGFRVARTVTP